ncbi:MAG: hypothetical protein AAF125_00665 [Chloroflexota bacterium]
MFYGITDSHAVGGDGFDLMLTRSYNSQLADVDGPFGRGWTSPFPLDYVVPFDETTLSRVVAPGNSFPAGLDVTFAPRGIVTFTTPTGSRHQFVQTDTTYDGGVLRSLSMPGWTLARDDRYDLTWELTQVDGYTYIFDRAGRLLSYATPTGGREITISYPGNSVTALGGTENVVTIRDGEEAGRELRLRYDANGRVVTATLEDTTVERETCTPSQSCFEVTYTYEGDLLTGVTYADGTTATYIYNDSGRLIEHIDPRAPISPQMRYTYDQTGRVGSVFTVEGDVETLYRQLTTTVSENRLTTNVTDELNNRRDYTYVYTVGDPRRIDNTFTLVRLTSPLAGIEVFEDIPQNFLWEEGRLIREDTRPLRGGEGRSAVSYAYNSFGQISCIACLSRALPELEVTYAEDEETEAPLPYPVLITYADGATDAYTYDADGRVLTHTDRFDALYNYTWDGEQLVQVSREADGATWDYAYNGAGLVTRVAHARGGTTPHIVNYTYEGLGRLIAVDDSTLGTYTVTYDYEDAEGVLLPRITVTDPVGAVSVVRFDERGRMVERSLETANALLSLDTFTYDPLDRLTSESTWLIDTVSGQPLTTSYRHERRPTLPPLLANESGTVINGTETVVTAPDGGVSRYAYDALGRLRLTADPLNQRTTYDYFVSEMRGYQFGLRVEERQLADPNRDVEEITYLFSNKRQLREILDGQRRWVFNIDADSTRISSIQPQVNNRTITLQGAFFGDYVGGRPSSMEVRPADLTLPSGYRVLNEHLPFREYAFDADGRVVAVADAEEDENPTVQAIVYCPRDGGGTRVLYGAGELGCLSDDFEMALAYDSAGRLIGADDANAVRVFTYTPDTEMNVWRVDASLVSDSGVAAWSFTYDSAGNILTWQGADGALVTYSYDTLGRLLTVETDQPETTLQFTYDVRGNLTRGVNGLGQGYLYNYDDRGLLVSQVDALSAAATSYSYTPDGRLTTVIGPEGNTTIYRYEDEADRTRITAVVDPTGNEHRFDWQDDANLLAYTDPRGATTRYRFDGNSLLWRIEEPVVIPNLGNRISELRYDDNGNLTGWLQDSRQGVTTSRLNIVEAAPGVFNLSEDASGWTGTVQIGPGGTLDRVDALSASYDALGRLSGIAVGEDFAWALAYATDDRLITVNGPEGGATTFRYDDAFRLLTERRAEGVTAVNYTAGLGGTTIAEVALPDGTVETVTGTPADVNTSRPATLTRVGAGYRLTYLYDGNERLTTIHHDLCADANTTDAATCAFERTTSAFEYDAAGRVRRATWPDGSFEAFEYDIAGRLETYQSRAGQRYTYGYDAFGRVARLSTPTGVKLLLQRDELGSVDGLCRTDISASDEFRVCVDDGGLIARYSYDVFGRRLTEVAALGDGERTMRYTYGPGGVVASRVSSDRIVGYTYDALGRLTAQTLEGVQQPLFDYRGLGRLAMVGERAVTFDALGRVTEADGLLYAYTPEGVGITDTTSTDALVTYGVDGRGLFADLSASGSPVMSLGALTNTGFVVTQSDGALVNYTTDPTREVLAVDYDGGGDFTVFHQPDANGTIRRQTMVRPVDSVGYGLVLGYDDDNRPLTLRVTDNTAQEVLFTQLFDYDDDGRLVREDRRYGDGTFVTLRYEYLNTTQLAQIALEVVRPAGQAARSSLPLMALVLMTFSAVRLRRLRPRHAIPLLVFVFAAGAFAPMLQGGTGESYTLVYRYTDAGAVDSVVLNRGGAREECIRYDYDASDRLTRVRYTDDAGADAEVTYSYDAFGRLATANDVPLRFNGERLMAVGSGADAIYYAGPSDGPYNGAVGADGAVTWLITDGRERVVGAVLPGESASADLWLFDPARRYLSLTAPTSGFNPCRATGAPSNVPTSLAVQPLDNGLVWDARTNLYFDGDRAYDPESARFLQPLSTPDALGTLYAAYATDVALPRVTDTPSAMSGLAMLEAAQAQVSINAGLSAEAVRVRYAPSPIAVAHPLAATRDAAYASYADSLYRLENLPVWLNSAYNLEAPSLDRVTGVITAPTDIVPAQRGDAAFRELVAYAPELWSEGVLNADSAATLLDITALAIPPQAPVGSLPTTWQATPSLLTLDAAYHVPSLDLDASYSVSAVLPWLPQPLENPLGGLGALRYVDALTDLPNQTHAEHVEALLDSALPTGLVLPPSTVEEYLGDLFSYDPFDLDGAHSVALPEAPAPDLPGLKRD